MSKACGNDECNMSQGTDVEDYHTLGYEALTFGSGRLTNSGYFEFPCPICARDWELIKPGEKCWPFENQNIEELKEKIIAQIIRDEDQMYGPWHCCM